MTPAVTPTRTRRSGTRGEVADMTADTTAVPADDQSHALRVLLTVEAAAERLSISRTRMYELIKSGEVMSVRVGRLRRIPVDALEAFIARLLSAQQSAA